ncbi:MAG TPA: four helix bundle protein [Luteolibacter sp.]|nr:four helix bundle protein [Luteolibacter sp.]
MSQGSWVKGEETDMSKSLNDLEVYREAMRLGEIVWGWVVNWKPLAQDTTGKQFIRAIDSIAANISEGHGRYHYKENLKFCYYSRGSLDESMTWLEKAATRQLVEAETARQLYRDLESLRKRLNAYIKSIGQKSATHDS